MLDLRAVSWKGFVILNMLMQVFFFCRQPSPNMALRFIDIQNFSGIFSKARVDLGKALCDIFMYRTLTNPKLSCRLAHCRVVIDNIFGYLNSSFLNITFQKISPAILVFTLYAGERLIMPGCKACFLEFLSKI